MCLHLEYTEPLANVLYNNDSRCSKQKLLNPFKNLSEDGLWFKVRTAFTLVTSLENEWELYKAATK